MRRIIERKVTVVTTTTWTISWEAEPPLSQPEVDSTQTIESQAAPSTPIPTQEADSTSADHPIQANSSSKGINSYPVELERKLEP